MMKKKEGFMTANQREPYAREWLMAQVKAKPRYNDFKIVNTREIIQSVYKQTIIYKFRCRYKDRTTAVMEEVERTFFVAYDYQDGKGEYMCPLL